MTRSTEEMFGDGFGDSGTDLPDGPEADAPQAAPQSGAAPAVADDAQGEPQQPDQEQGPPKDDLSALKASLEERDKRIEEYDRQMSQMQGQLSSIMQLVQGKTTQQEPEKPLPKFYDSDDPDQLLTAREARLKQEFESRVKQAEQAASQRFAALSEVYARASHPDYDEVRDAFVRHVNRLPNANETWEYVYAQPSPAEYVYKAGRQILGKTEPTENEKRLQAEIEELKKQIAGGGAAPQAQQQAQAQGGSNVIRIPKSQGGARGSGYTPSPEWTGPRTTEQMFG